MAHHSYLLMLNKKLFLAPVEKPQFTDVIEVDFAVRLVLGVACDWDRELGDSSISELER
ncbi:hypothetical protein RJZ57_007039, partial [Blastomyces gilchristii]